MASSAVLSSRSKNSPKPDIPVARFFLGGRAVQVAGIVLLFVGGYFTIGLSADPIGAGSLHTPLDDRIPFVAESIFVYASVYVSVFFPAFVVRCPRLFQRVTLAYVVVIVIALTCFVCFPVTSAGLRPDMEGLDPTRFSEWGIKTLYGLDPAVNLFPSLHVAVATLAVLSSWKARARYGGIPLIALAAITVSTCTVKQHFWIDGVAGIVLAGAVYAVTLRPFDTAGSSREELAHSWRGPLAFLALLISGYLGAYVAFAAGLEPWN